MTWRSHVIQHLVLAKNNHVVTSGYSLVSRYANFGNYSIMWSCDFILHFHSFKDQQSFAFFNCLTSRYCYR